MSALDDDEGQTSMPTMTNTRRKKIQARQRKARNELQRLAKAAKRERNAAKKAASGAAQ